MTEVSNPLGTFSSKMKSLRNENRGRKVRKKMAAGCKKSNFFFTLSWPPRLYTLALATTVHWTTKKNNNNRSRLQVEMGYSQKLPRYPFEKSGPTNIEFYRLAILPLLPSLQTFFLLIFHCFGHFFSKKMKFLNLIFKNFI